MTTTTPDPTPNPTLNRTVIAFTYLGLLLVGVQVTVLGPAKTGVVAGYGLNDTSFGWFAAVQSAGALLGNIWSSLVVQRVSSGKSMMASMVLFALSSVALVLANTPTLAFVAAFFSGLGFGTFQGHYATLFSRGFGERSRAMMSFMSTAFASGAILGPNIVGFVGSQNFRWLYALCAIAACVVAPVVRGVKDQTSTTTKHDNTQQPRDALVLALLFALMSFFYVLCEGATNLWMATHLQRVFAWTESNAAFMTSGFWITLTLGRVVCIPLLARFSSAQALTAGMAVAVLGCGLCFFGPLVALGYLLVGLGLATIFPTGMVWLGRSTPRPAATSAYMVGGTFGGLLAGPVFGASMVRFGTASLPWGLIVAGVATMLLLQILARVAPNDAPKRNT